MQERYRDSDPAAVIELRQKQQTLSNLFGQVDGSANRVVNSQLAQISAGLRNIESMSKLGGVVLTHLGALPTKAAELRYHGIGLLERYGNFFSSFLKGFDSAAQREITDLTLAGMEGAHGRMMAPGWVDDSLPGTMSKISNRFFNLTGLPTMLNWQKGGTGDLMARALGKDVDKSFDALMPQRQRMLSLYGIKPADWDALRTAPGHLQIDGRTFLTPDAAKRSTVALSDGARDMLGLKLATLYSDIADRGVITPGSAERNDILGATLRGTPEGEAARFFMQFKLWSLAAVRQGFGREIYGGQGTAGAVSGMMQLVIASTVMGYLIGAMKDVSKGLTPRSPTDPATWFAAMAQGGGAGILGDFLFGQTNRFGQSFAETLLGPVAGEGLSSLMTVWNNLKAGEGKKIPSELLHIGLNNTPFINLFYARSAMNYLFLNSLQETLNPGYLRRAQRNLKRDSGQVSYLSPETYLKPFGH